MTKKKVDAGSLLFAVTAAVVIGVAVGFGAGFAARAFDWPTGFVGPLTGAVVSALVVLFYQTRTTKA